MSDRWRHLLIGAWLVAATVLGSRAHPHVADAGSGRMRLLPAWALHPDSGDLFVVDEGYRVRRLAGEDLRHLAESPQLFHGAGNGAVYLAAAGGYAVLSAESVTTTVLLDAASLQPLADLPRAGPVAVDPKSARLFMVSEGRLTVELLNGPGKEPEVMVEAIRPGGVGDMPLGVTIEPHSRRLYVRFYGNHGSPPHNREFYRAYGLDDLQPETEFERVLGAVTRPAFAGNGALVAIGVAAKNGFWSSGVTLFDAPGQKLQVIAKLPGIPALDPTGRWLYVLRRRGLWALDGGTYDLVAVHPFGDDTPHDVLVSADGARLFLLMADGVESLNALEFRAAGFPTVSPLPAGWLPRSGTLPDAPAFFPSPTMADDGAAFVQPDESAETYRSSDGGVSWQFLPAVTFPFYRHMRYLSLSPDFGRDRTLVGRPGGLGSLLRSTDGGETWLEWRSRIAFVSDRAGTRDVYTMDGWGENVRQVTSDPGDEENPAWSPAWSRLAYQARPAGNWDVFVVAADCTGSPDCASQPLTDDPADDMLPAWSPDGRLIAFVSTRDGNPEIYVMQADGNSPRRLTFNSAGDWRPAWMPDSRHLVFTSDRAGTNDVYRLEVPDGDAAPQAEQGLVRIVSGPADDRDPAVNAEGRLAFLSDRDGVMKTYELDLRYDSMHPRAHTDSQWPEAHPAWIDDAGYAVLVTREEAGATNIYLSEYPDQYRALTSGRGFDGHPSWGPTWWRPDPAESQAELEAFR